MTNQGSRVVLWYPRPFTLGDEPFPCRVEHSTSKSGMDDAVVNDPETDWAVFDYGRPISRKKFTQILKDFGAKPIKRSNANFFYVADLEDAFKRYLTHT